MVKIISYTISTVSISMAKINLLVIKTLNPDALASFYTQLGITFNYHQHGKGPFHYSANLEGVVFEIYPLPKGETKADKTLRLGFSVENLDQTMEKVVELQE